MAEPVHGPSTSGSVVLELGPGIGALLLHTPPELDGAEIEISPVGDPAEPGENHNGHRTHSQVRPRQMASGTQYAAVYPGLAVGDYTVWRDEHSKALDITISSGQVTIAWWPGQ
jgi:hypothetical protein